MNNALGYTVLCAFVAFLVWEARRNRANHRKLKDLAREYQERHEEERRSS